MEILYAFLRVTDDLADSPVADDEVGANHAAKRLDSLDRWRRTVSAALDSNDGATNAIFSDAISTDVGADVLPALAETVRTYQIDPADLLAAVDGCRDDCAGPVRFETEADAFAYCDRVATSVGRATLAILGLRCPWDDAVRRAAESCGRAFQWTNFLRDLLEDYRRKRLYFPMSDFLAGGLTPEELLRFTETGPAARPIVDFRLRDPYDPLAKFFAIQFERTEKLYADARPLDELVAADARPTFLLMKNVYAAIFEKIRRSPSLIFTRRVRLSFWEKLRLLRK